MKNTPVLESATDKSLQSNFIFVLNRLLVLFIFVFAVGSSTAFASTGFDFTFGNDGKVISSPDGSELIRSNDLAVQTDGKIVMVGGKESNSGSFIVARYNANGSPDMTFGGTGWISTSFGSDTTSARSVDIQTDGKIVVGGSITFSSGASDFAVARYNSDGSLDTTFDGDGKAIVSFNPEVITSVGEGLTALKIAPDGKIVVAGSLSFFPQIGRFALARLNSDGSLDTTFGANGRLVPESSVYNILNALTILPDGSPVIVGQVPQFNSRIAQKYNAAGVLVWTFFQSDGEFNRGGLNGVAALPDGKIIIVGIRNSANFTARLNADGTLDSTFNAPVNFAGEGTSVAVQPDGKIVSNISVSGGSTFSLARFNTNGSLDTSFGANGILTTRLTTGTDTGRKVLIQPDGKILVGGYSFFSSSNKFYFSLARFRNDAVVTNRPQFDYDGDGKSDVSVYRPSNSVWYFNQSTNGFFAAQFGNSTDRIVPADYDGDNKTDLAIYRDGVWWILQSGNNSVKAVQFGLTEDKPQSGDFDGDGKDDLVVFRPSTSVWYILRSSDNGFTATQWGLSSDIPQSADYDGDCRADIAVFRPSNGTWYVQRSLGGNLFIQFGANGDKPVASDYDGDNRTDLAVWRAPTRQWFIFKSSNNQADIKDFGISTDIPAPADYDGDGKTDLAVFRPSNGSWHQMLSTQGSASQLFGLSGDLPTPGAFNP